MEYESALALGVLIPLVGFVILALFGHRLGKPTAGYVALVAMGLSCVLATGVLIGWLGLDAGERELLTDATYRFHWGELGDIPIDVGVKLDSLTVIMYFMVTFVSFWIFFFSIGYMEGHSDEVDGQSKYHRFFTYLSLFAFSMLGLVVSSSLLFLFIFWELVGLCSYLLIGFYFDKKFASDAAIKAFVTNRVGDFGFIIGMALVVLYLGTFDLDEAAGNFAADFHAHAGIFASDFTLLGFSLATLMGIGLFCGAMGKSAQFPLHVWLPDAMAGPTPVSALIHAATMVAAGVYLVARVFRLLTPEAQFFVAVIGCITLTITALIAVVQTDIKKVLAYSTLSQLGYMIFGLGVGAWIAALFHLMTHAFFKAMLFLCSGQVIEGCHHEQDIRNMGGLRKKMPVTCWTFFVGVLAIAGFGIPGTHWGLGGFFSKDEILAVAYERAFNIPALQQSDAAADSAGEHGSAPPHASQAPAQAALAGTAVSLAAMAQVQGDGPESSDDDSSNTPLTQPQRKRRRLTDEQMQQRQRQSDRLLTRPQRERLLHGGAFIREGDLVQAESHAAGLLTKTSIADALPALPKWMFYLPIVIAYVTPFYMMRCWWLTFCGKPRDRHVYDHAHENWKMFVPLVVLAVGTVFCSYWVFRPLLANAAGPATDCPTIVAIDGVATHDDIDHALVPLTHTPGSDPHAALVGLVGFAWIIGIGVAWLIYRNGLAGGEWWRKRLRPVHRFLEQKMYFDHVYNNVLVSGMIALGGVMRLFDNIVVDGLVNLAGFFTRAIGIFTGRQLDMPVERGDIGVVDWIANALARVGLGIGTAVRRPQTGRIRTYVLLTAGSAAVVLLAVLIIGGG
jgi:proton-translocating NADH-quinone oxidoreductase chain L